MVTTGQGYETVLGQFLYLVNLNIRPLSFQVYALVKGHGALWALQLDLPGLKVSRLCSCIQDLGLGFRNARRP